MTRNKRPQSSSGRRPAGSGGPPASDPARGGDRLQKVLAAAGLGSRRQCEELILEGRVEIDGKVAELGTRADPTRQDIRIDGVKLPQPERVYFALNKPVGVVCTHRDPAARTRVIDLVDTPQRVFPVGRLDRASEGLILLTNDGEFANEIAHPRYEVEKTYRVIVAGEVAPETTQKLLKGVYLAEGVARAQAVKIRKKRKQSTEMEIVLSEGRNREIRRILARLGHKVQRLKRIAIGPLRLGEMPTGAYRPLQRREITELREAAVASRRRHKAAGKARSSAKSDAAPSPSLPPPSSTRLGKVLAFDDEGGAPPARRPARGAKSGGGKRPGGNRPAKGQGKAGAKAKPKTKFPPRPRKPSRPPRKGKRS